jgi:tripartite-type tricarboxylate transporter receptor subunit TctC
MIRASPASVMKVLAGLMLGLGLTAASAQDTFSYKNRTITLYAAGSAGGGYDFYARLLARHMGRHLPGAPTVVVKNMPGAGGLLLANYLQARAARDGTEFAALEHGTVFAPLLNNVRVEFDPARFGWLGSMEHFTPIVAVWHTVPIYSADDLMVKSMTVGSSGAGSTTWGYPHSLNAILGTKMKVVAGYPGSAEINLAIERGELDGVSSWCWTCLKAEKPHWLAEKKMRVVMQLAPTGDPELTRMNIPTVFDRATSDEQRQMLNTVFGSVGMSRPFVAPPDLPPERLAMLRKGFEEAVKDPSLIADAAGKGFVVEFIAPQSIEAIISNAYGADPRLIDKVRAAYSGK